MQTLLDHILAAHGGLAHWNQFNTLSAHLSQGGVLWPLKGKSGMLDEVDINITLHQPWTSHSPFGIADRRTAVTPLRVLIESAAGTIYDELVQPRDSFRGHKIDTPWSDTQLAYFVGYAIWNYFTMPFLLSRPGFAIKELPEWHENGQIWRRLQATFPDDVPTHSPVQTFYFSDDGMMRRHDYDVDIAGGAPAVHYLSGHATVQGIVIPTKHMVYVRDQDLGHQLEPLVVSIEASQITLA